jgi:hypothetical protein
VEDAMLAKIIQHSKNVLGVLIHLRGFLSVMSCPFPYAADNTLPAATPSTAAGRRGTPVGIFVGPIFLVSLPLLLKHGSQIGILLYLLLQPLSRTTAVKKSGLSFCFQTTLQLFEPMYPFLLTGLQRH